MQYVGPSPVGPDESDFAREVREQSGVNFHRCYQCLSCTLSCPISLGMDYLPNQLVRKIQLGAREDVLGSKIIWRCASCETCITRCPHKIDIPHLMDTLRQMALRENVSMGDRGIPIFHRVFLNNIRQWGRQYELGMLLSFKVKAKDLFSDIGLGVKMLQKGKLRLLPSRSKARQEVKEIFKKLT